MTIQQPDGIHHIAIMSANMKEQLTFFTQVMGFPLVGLFDMHGVPGGKHAFLQMADDSFFSVVELAGIAEISSTIGITHAGTGAGKCAAGTMQHIAFRVPDEAGLTAMQNRIRSHGVPAIGPIGHGFCKSIYFAGPEGLTLEVSYAVSEVDPKRWVDPAMLAECGISGEEAQAMLNPPPCLAEVAVPQPAYDANKPQLAYPVETLKAMLSAPDAAITMQGSYNEPPVAAMMRWSDLAAAALALALGACGPNLGDYQVVDVKLVNAFPADPNSFDSIAEGAKQFPEFLRIEVSSQFDLSKAETGGGLYVEGDRCPIKNSDRLIALDIRASDALPTQGWLRKAPLRANAVDHKFHYFIYVVPSSPARKVFTNSSDTIDAYDLQRVPKSICLRLFAPGYYLTKSRSRPIEVSADSIARAFAARSE